MSNIQDWKKFVFTCDWHLGKEHKRKSGTVLERETVITHQPKLIGMFWEFVKDFKPDYIIFGGDQLNCGPVSRWHHGKPTLKNFSLKYELDLLDKLIISPLQGLGFEHIPVWLTGNHEDWIRQWLDANPEMEGIIDLDKRLKDAGFIVRGLGEMFRIGNLDFAHGDTVTKKRNLGQNPARTLASSYNRNVRAGHLHTGHWAIKDTAIDSPEKFSGAFVPGLCKPEFDYGLKAPNNCINGFNYGYINKKKKIYNDYFVIISSNKFIAEGKLYE